MQVNFPLLKTFQIEEYLIDFLNEKFEKYSLEQKLFSAENSIYISDTGVYTFNLCKWNDENYRSFIKDDLLGICSNQLNIDKENIDIHYTHFFDYRQGGKVEFHNHIDHEDYVMIVYVNTCSKGDTVFYLNHHPNYRHRTKIKIKPTKGLGSIFSSMLFHEAEFTEEPKRIFVVGIKIDLD